MLYTADLTTDEHIQTATFSDDKAVTETHKHSTIAANLLQTNLDMIERWAKTWRLNINETKSVHVTFTKCRGNIPYVTLNGQHIPQAESVKYLGRHLDKGLTWRTHIFTKRKQLNLKLIQYNSLVGRKSKLSQKNKLLIYKAALKPVWTYGVQLLGTTSNSNIEILERIQS